VLTRNNIFNGGTLLVLAGLCLSIQTNFSFASTASTCQDYNSQCEQMLEVELNSVINNTTTSNSGIADTKTKIDDAIKSIVGNIVIDKGSYIPGYHCSSSNDASAQIANNECKPWAGSAPDIGPFEKEVVYNIPLMPEPIEPTQTVAVTETATTEPVAETPSEGAPVVAVATEPAASTPAAAEIPTVAEEETTTTTSSPLANTQINEPIATNVTAPTQLASNTHIETVVPSILTDAVSQVADITVSTSNLAAGDNTTTPGGGSLNAIFLLLMSLSFISLKLKRRYS